MSILALDEPNFVIPQVFDLTTLPPLIASDRFPIQIRTDRPIAAMRCAR